MNYRKVFEKLRNYYKSQERTSLNRMRRDPNPFRILIGCLISLGIKDSVTEKILEEIFSKINSFEDVIDYDLGELEDMLYFARFRRVKAARMKEVSKEILERFNGVVPNTREELESIKGVGRKTANIVLNFAFGKNYIPVDSNTIRIVNRLGWIESKNPVEIEEFLVEKFEGGELMDLNGLIMLHGRDICTPLSPYCGKCPVEGMCGKVGVDSSR